MTTQSGDRHVLKASGRIDADWWGARATFVLCVVGLAITQLNPNVLAGDPLVYRMRAEAVFGGQIPYFDFPFEHFPVAIAPMLLAWIVGGAFSLSVYQFVFAAMMVMCLVGTARILRSVGPTYLRNNPDHAWLTLILPLLPFVIFRSEPWIVLLFVTGLAATVLGQQTKALLAGTAAVLAKGWPVVLTPVAWAKGARRNAVVLAAVGVVSVVGLALLPGFISGRQFTGLHTESLVGGLLALVRVIRGETIGRIDAAGATYLEASSEALMVQVFIGFAIAVLALVRVEELNLQNTTRLAAALVGATLVGTPLLSPQFLLWLTPLVALVGDRLSRRLMLATGWFSLVYLAGLVPDLHERAWVVYVLNLRNALLLILAIYLALSVSRPASRTVKTDPVTSWQEWIAWVTAAVVAAWIVLAMAHIGDLYQVDHASRVRVALAQSIQSEGLYPSLFDGTTYGGTRFMPLPLLVHGWLSTTVTGLIPVGKALNYVSVVAVGALAFLLSRRRNALAVITLGVFGAWLLSPAGLFTTLGIRWDAIALAVQLTAILVAGRITISGPANRRFLLIGLTALLCVAAVLAKTSALWASLAITVWLLFRSWKTAVVFFCTYVAILAGGLLATDYLLHGTLLPNIGNLSAIGVDGGFSIGRSFQRFWSYNQAKMPIGAAILAIAAVSIARTVRSPNEDPWRDRLARLDLSQWSFVFAGLVTLFVMSDIGIAENHFIDYAVLGAILAGDAVMNRESGRWFGQRRHEPQMVALGLCVVISVSLVPSVGSDIEEIVGGRQRANRYAVSQLRDVVPSDRSVFSEDPFVHVLRMETPPMLDSWMFKRMVERALVPSEPLVTQIRNTKFDYLILWNWEPEAVNDYLTANVRQAIGDAYALCNTTADLNVYRPRQAGC